MYRLETMCVFREDDSLLQETVSLGPDSRQKWRPTHWPFPMAAGSPWHADRQPCRTTQVPLFTHRLCGPGWTTAWTTRWLQYPIGLYIEFQGHLELLSARCNFFCHQKCLVDLPSQRYLTPCLAGSTYCSWGSVLLLSVSRDGFSIHTYMCLWFCMFCVLSDLLPGHLLCHLVVHPRKNIMLLALRYESFYR